MCERARERERERERLLNEMTRDPTFNLLGNEKKRVRAQALVLQLLSHTHTETLGIGEEAY